MCVPNSLNSIFDKPIICCVGFRLFINKWLFFYVQDEHIFPHVLGSIFVRNIFCYCHAVDGRVSSVYIACVAKLGI